MPTLSSLSPQPAHAGDLVTATGPDFGVCDQVFLEVSTTVQGPAGAAQSVTTKQAVTTRISQNSVTFQMPDFAITARVTASVKGRVVINSAVSYTNLLSLDVDPPVQLGPPASTPPPSYGYGIAAGPTYARAVVQRWKFTDPLDTNPLTGVYLLPINPNKMTSPFPTRKITSSFTTAVDGQALLVEGAPSLTQWTFGGEIFDAQHYDLLRSWVYDRRRRITVTDHFGRDIVCVFEKFDATPALTRIGNGKYWRHTYTITATVISVGAPTVLPRPGDPVAGGGGTGAPSATRPPNTPAPSPGPAGSQIYYFPNALLVWRITHTLGPRPIVSTVDSSNQAIFGSVAYPADNQVSITFSAPQTGSATLA